jgi:hypothetical protein
LVVVVPLRARARAHTHTRHHTRQQGTQLRHVVGINDVDDNA